MASNVKPFIKIREPRKEHYAVGPCPFCGRLDTWLNNLPLTAFCGGSEENPHEEWAKQVPAPHNIYLDGYNSAAPVETVEYEDRRQLNNRQLEMGND